MINHDPKISSDPWILSSQMQKAIRRGDNTLAGESWRILSAIDSKRAWRRLLLIAFEDIGIADLDAVLEVTAVCSAKGLKNAVGRELVERLALTSKDRSADYLFSSCIRHPLLQLERIKAAQTTDHELLNLLGSSKYSLQIEALAAIILLQRPKERRDFNCSRATVAKAIVERVTENRALRIAIEAALRKFGEPFLLMLPLLASSVQRATAVGPKIIQAPPSKCVGGVPMYALDKHTRVGRAAIREFAAKNDNVRSCLNEFVKPPDLKSAAYMAAYYTDAIPVSNRFMWSESDRLENLGREADMYYAGVPLEGVKPILEAFRSNLVHLDEIRARLFLKKFGRGTYESGL